MSAADQTVINAVVEQVNKLMLEIEQLTKTLKAQKDIIKYLEKKTELADSKFASLNAVLDEMLKRRASFFEGKILSTESKETPSHAVLESKIDNVLNQIAEIKELITLTENYQAIK